MTVMSKCINISCNICINFQPSPNGFPPALCMMNVTIVMSLRYGLCNERLTDIIYGHETTRAYNQ